LNEKEELKFEDGKDSFSMQEEELDDISSIIGVPSTLITCSEPPSLSQYFPSSSEDNYQQENNDEENEQQLLNS
jgi:hypothetical protein